MYIQARFFCLKNEEGSILLVTMLLLILLTLIGIAATNTTSIEVSIAGNEKRYKQDFYIAEGGATQEVSDIGYADVTGLYPWYLISDPEDYNKLLFPPTSADYDPSGHDMPTADVNAILSGSGPRANDPDTWPRQNLMHDITDNKYDYAYLVTYLYPDVPPKGMNATQFSFYKFRIDGQRQVVVEMGGGKTGPKNSF